MKDTWCIEEHHYPSGKEYFTAYHGSEVYNLPDSDTKHNLVESLLMTEYSRVSGVLETNEVWERTALLPPVE